MAANVDQPRHPEREIVASRRFAAPRALVWKAFTEPEQIAHWWGPRGFTVTIDEMDVRPGGAWRFVLHGPGGTDYRNEMRYVEIAEPALLVMDHLTGPTFRFRVSFEELGGQTEVTVRMLFATAQERDQTVEQFGAEKGLHENLDKLAEHTAVRAAGALHLTRTFRAPRALVWKAMTEPDHLRHWWGPKGFTWVSSQLDLRPEGRFHYCLRAPNGAEMWGLFDYVDVAPLGRLTFINSFSNPAGGVERAPFAADFPLRVLNVQTLEELGAETRLTHRGIPFEASAAEQAFFAAMHPSMQGGFKGTYDQLDAYLLTQQ